MIQKKRIKKSIKDMILKDDEVLEITTAVEGPLGYENSANYRLTVDSKGRLNIEKMTPCGWRFLS